MAIAALNPRPAMAAASRRARRVARRSRTVHGLYKFGRIAGDASLRAWGDVRRTRAVVRVLPNTMLPAPRLLNAYDCVRVVDEDGIPGDVAECGVWSGGGIGLMALAHRRSGDLRRTFHLFDSFEGLPQPSALDDDVLEGFRSAHPGVPLDCGSGNLIAVGDCKSAPVEEVEWFLRRTLHIEREHIAIHKGWFQDTIPGLTASFPPLAILRLDGDLYESTKVCLEGLYDKVVPGGFVIIDDYGRFAGCRRATDDFLRERGIDLAMWQIDAEGVYLRKAPAENGSPRL